MEQNFCLIGTPAVPVLKTGVELFFLDYIDNAVVLCKGKIISARIIVTVERGRCGNSEVEYGIQDYRYRTLRDKEIGKKYFLSKYDLFNAIDEFKKEDSKGL